MVEPEQACAAPGGIGALNRAFGEVLGTGDGGFERLAAGETRGGEVEMLRRALHMETEAGEFYKRMVKELPEEARPLFARFVEIEDGHTAIVQAELDYASGSGFMFDFRDFEMV